MIGVRVKPFSIPPAHRKRPEAVPQAPQEWQPHKPVVSSVERAARGHFSYVPYDGMLREVLDRKIEQLKEVEEFLAEGLELGLPKFAEELKKDVEALRRKLGNGE